MSCCSSGSNSSIVVVVVVAVAVVVVVVVVIVVAMAITLKVRAAIGQMAKLHSAGSSPGPPPTVPSGTGRRLGGKRDGHLNKPVAPGALAAAAGRLQRGWRWFRNPVCKT